VALICQWIVKFMSLLGGAEEADFPINGQGIGKFAEF
jgi:hypothetical protein